MLDDNKYNELDETFGKAFSEYEEQPSSKVWDGIDSQLDDINDQAVDETFATAFASYEEQASDRVWNGIDNRLDQEKTKRRIVYYQWIAAASVLIAVSVIGYNFLGSNTANTLADNKFIESEDIIPDTESEKNLTNSASNNSTEFSTEPVVDELAISNDVSQASNEVTTTNDKPQSPVPSFVDQETPDQRILVDNSITLNNSSGSNSRYPVKNNAVVSSSHEDQPKVKKLAFINKIEGVSANSISTFNSDEILAGLTIAYESVPLEDNFTQPRSTMGKWSLGASYSPDIAYRSLGNNESFRLSSTSTKSSGVTTRGNPSNNYFNSVESPKLAYTSGVRINYGLGRKWELQSGVLLASLGQVSVPALEDYVVQGSGFGSIETNPQSAYEIHTSAGVIQSQPTDNNNSYQFNQDQVILANTFDPTVTSSATYVSPQQSPDQSASEDEYHSVQTYNYISLPFVTRYHLTDRKLSLGISGGFAANFLVSNQTSITQNDGSGSRTIIEDNIESLNPVLYTGLFSVGAAYRLSNSFEANFEPTLRYSLSPLNRGYSFKSFPYSFGIASGITYRF